MSRGIFTGRCYLCGEMCGRTYCHEHKWAATYLAMPYRRDLIPVPTRQLTLAAPSEAGDPDERRRPPWSPPAA